MKQMLLFLLLVVLLVGCSNTDGSNSDSTNTIDIRNVDVQVEELTASLVADVKTSSDKIFYRVELGEEVLQNEERIQLNGHAEWKPFELGVTLPEKVMKVKDAPIFVIYGKSENGEEINPNYIPIEIK